MKPEIIDYVSPTSFYPPPKVWSALLLLRRYRVWREEDETLEKLIKCLFNQRRKKALKIVKECVDKLSPRRLEESELRNLIGEKRVYELSASTINAIHELITSK
jgi:16S rRNA A1518/A1519 N6-dimethyltransferase RsmA/KsgA/DIM1 with predicted DNA glycosylase/AP lyase activity